MLTQVLLSMRPAQWTKNAVLLEATRAIFSAGATGYIEAKDAEDSSLKIVEIAKGLSSKS